MLTSIFGAINPATEIPGNVKEVIEILGTNTVKR